MVTKEKIIQWKKNIVTRGQDTTQNKMKIITPQTETWQNIKFIYMLWGPIPHHLLCPLSSPYFHYFSPLPCPTTPPLPLPTSTFTPTTLLSPFNYHQSASITHPPLNYNATATPPSLLINYHYQLFDGYQQ